MALRIVEARYYWSVPSSNGKPKICLSGHGLFPKWVEAEVLANIRDVDVKKFVWRNKVTRFGVQESLVSDNRLQFDSKTFRKFCSNLGIKNKYSTPAYP